MASLVGQASAAGNHKCMFGNSRRVGAPTSRARADLSARRRDVRPLVRAMPPSRKRKAVAASSAPQEPEPAPADVSLAGGTPCPDGQIRLWKTEALCDVTIHVEGESFLAHRMVLAGASEYMRALATSGMSDSADVTISDMSAPVFSAALQWMYMGACVVSERLLDSLLEASCRLQIGMLKDAATEAIVARINPLNAAAFWERGCAHDHPRLVEAAREVAIRQFSALVGTPGFLKMPADRLAEVLASDCVDVDETRCFEAASKWAVANNASADDIEKVFSRIRFGLLGADYLRSRVENDAALAGHPRGGWIVARALTDALDTMPLPRTGNETRVEIVDPGMWYSAFRKMATHLGVTDEWSSKDEYSEDIGPTRGDIGVAVARADHSGDRLTYPLAVRVVVAVRMLSGRSQGTCILMEQSGLKLLTGRWPEKLAWAPPPIE